MEATVHEVSKSQTRLSDSHNTHTLRGKGVSLSVFFFFFFLILLFLIFKIHLF